MTRTNTQVNPETQTHRNTLLLAYEYRLIKANVEDVCLSLAMHESSKNLQACLADMYEQDWYGKNEVDSIVEVRNTFYYFFKNHIK